MSKSPRHAKRLVRVASERSAAIKSDKYNAAYYRLRAAIANLHRVWFLGADIDKDKVTQACLALFAEDMEIANGVKVKERPLKVGDLVTWGCGVRSHRIEAIFDRHAWVPTARGIEKEVQPLDTLRRAVIETPTSNAHGNQALQAAETKPSPTQSGER